tara:strand:- start:3 stop:599 length:597 start_codon:yes stop_codon:yes gene_type:complete
MDKSFKIVLIAFAIYFVLAIQFFFEKGQFIIPDILNPVVLFTVSGIILFQSYKKENFNVNLIYFIGILIYAFGSERTLNLLYNNTQVSFFLKIIQNPFLKLITILSLFGVATFINVVKSIKFQKLQIISLILLIITLIAGLSSISYQLIYVISFTTFVILFYFLNRNVKSNQYILSVNYQLLLFAILENSFFILNNYC